MDLFRLNVDLDVDLSLLLDGSWGVQADEYVSVKELLASVLEQTKVSEKPWISDKQARVALYQTSPSYHLRPGAESPAQKEFDFTTYTNNEDMRKHLLEDMHQLGGMASLGHAVEWVIKQGSEATNPRKNKMVLAMVGGKTSESDIFKLEQASRMAKCQGVGVFVMTMGHRFDKGQVEELASSPLDQHVLHLGEVRAPEREYARRFLQAFLGNLKRGVNNYNAPEMCRRGQGPLSAFGPKVDSVPLSVYLRQKGHVNNQETRKYVPPVGNVVTRQARRPSAGTQSQIPGIHRRRVAKKILKPV